ncbi:MAG: hypothetical protein JW814_06045 [Candidatus Krumholzibacteriota bacterium]|nr:hypothetical protein [Candidatus Krumholzibacteriota bacterium]
MSEMNRNRNILVITGKNGFFGQTRKPWVSIDTGLFVRSLAEAGFETEVMTFDEACFKRENIKNRVIIYTFSQKSDYRQYLGDIVTHLSENNRVIPSIDLLRCHENKGYQELLKSKLGIKTIRTFYACDPSSIENCSYGFPVVLKAVSGSNGNQVYLAQDSEHLMRLIRKHFINIGLPVKIDLLRRKYLRKEKTYLHYPDYSNRTDLIQYTEYMTQYRPFILQEFIPGLEYDYRVLVMDDRSYVMKRHIKKNDFRASGTKLHDFDFTPADDLLEFARSIFDRFDTPLLSLDICEKDGKYYFFEFQALHFGMNVVIKSKGFYSRASSGWKFNRSTESFEVVLAGAYTGYLDKRR